MNSKTNKSTIRKNEILKASQELFVTKGFSNTTVKDIMQKAGAVKGAFYYYFDNKEQVLDALVNQNIEEIAKAMTKVATVEKLNPLEKLKLMLIEEFRINFEDYDSKNHMHNISNVDMHQKILVSMTYKLAPIFQQVIEQGRSEGVFQIQYPLEASEILISGIHFITDLGIFHWNKEEYFKKVKASEELIEKVLCLKPGSFDFLNNLLENIPDRVQEK